MVVRNKTRLVAQGFTQVEGLDFGDNESVVKIATNPVQHSRTKHIDIRHHFLRDHVNKSDIKIDGIGRDDQLADIFTKPLDES